MPAFQNIADRQAALREMAMKQANEQRKIDNKRQDDENKAMLKRVELQLKADAQAQEQKRLDSEAADKHVSQNLDNAIKQGTFGADMEDRRQNVLTQSKQMQMEALKLYGGTQQARGVPAPGKAARGPAAVKEEDGFLKRAIKSMVGLVSPGSQDIKPPGADLQVHVPEGVDVTPRDGGLSFQRGGGEPAQPAMPAAQPALAPGQTGDYQESVPVGPNLEEDPVQGIGPVTLPMAPDFTPSGPVPGTAEATEETYARRDQYIRDKLPAYQRYRDNIRTIQDGLQATRSEVTTRQLQINEYRRQLAMNPPTYRQAVSSLNLFQVIGAAAHLFLVDQTKHPSLFDTLVAKELHDLKAQHTAADTYLNQSQNLWTEFYKRTKDEAAADALVEGSIYKSIQDELKLEAEMAGTPEAIAKAQQGDHVLQAKQDERQAKVQSSLFNTVMQGQMKLIEAALKGNKAGPTVKESLAVQKEVVQLGGNSFARASTQASDKIRVQKAYSRKVIQATDAIENDLKKLGVGSFLLSTVSSKHRAILKNINRRYIDLALGKRITFTGGGNMSNEERQFLLGFYEVVESKVLDINQKREQLDMLIRNYKGDYNSLNKLIRKAEYNTLYNEFHTGTIPWQGRLGRGQSSRAFKDLSVQERHRLIAKEMGLNAKDAREYSLDVNRKGKQWE